MEIFTYTFMQHAFISGIIVGAIAPLIGIFLVLRRYALISDTLAHASLAGVALGLFAGWNPLLTALGVTTASSLAIEKLRATKRLTGEWSLALFLSGSLAFAIILLSLKSGAAARVTQYLFGSIVTVTTSDIYLMLSLAVIIVTTITYNWGKLISIAYDEEYAQVMGIPVKRLNTALMLMSAATITIAIPTLGVLLISALIVIPVITALQYNKNFITTLVYAEIISIFSVITGIVLAYYLDLATSGVIVLIMIALFLGTIATTKR